MGPPAVTRVLNTFSPLPFEEMPEPFWMSDVVTATPDHESITRVLNSLPVSVRQRFGTILNHQLQVLCSNNIDHFNLLNDWLAHMLQLPGIHPPKAIIFVGKEGIGKSAFFALLQLMLGYHHYLACASMHDILQQFNGLLLKGPLMIAINEMEKTHHAMGLFKGLISERETTVEPKGVDRTVVPFYARIIGATNDDMHPMPMIEGIGRRVAFILCSAMYQYNEEYFRYWTNEIQTPQMASLFYFWLLRRVVTVNFHAPVVTPMSKQLHYANLPLPKRWFVECYRLEPTSVQYQFGSHPLFERDDGGHLIGVTDVMFQHFLQWIRANNITYTRNTDILTFRVCLRQLLPHATQEHVSDSSSNNNDRTTWFINPNNDRWNFGTLEQIDKDLGPLKDLFVGLGKGEGGNF
jgi:hypothetical protein